MEQHEHIAKFLGKKWHKYTHTQIHMYCTLCRYVISIVYVEFEYLSLCVWVTNFRLTYSYIVDNIRLFFVTFFVSHLLFFFLYCLQKSIAQYLRKLVYGVVRNTILDYLIGSLLLYLYLYHLLFTLCFFFVLFYFCSFFFFIFNRIFFSCSFFFVRILNSPVKGRKQWTMVHKTIGNLYYSETDNSHVTFWSW